jgi:aryl-alcohol dehydrogenase-like predicted oxidoreductase
MSHDDGISRRDFVRTVLGSAALVAAADCLKPLEALAADSPAPKTMPRRPLGKTGFNVGLFSLGGQATLEEETKRDAAVEIIHRALDLGVNYIDTAALYGRGASELAIGDVMRTRRKDAFLASKTYDRSYDGSMRLLELSLKRLQTDHLDLWQVHNIQTDVDVDFVFSREGAVRAMEKARDQGIVRFLGITGHRDPVVLRKAIERYPFDTILMALNAADKHQASFIENLLPTAVEQNMGILGMKIPSRGRIFHETGIRSMDEAMHYVLSLPVSSVVIGISTMRELEENVRIATGFAPLTRAEMNELERLTQPYFADALWYRDHM